MEVMGNGGYEIEVMGNGKELEKIRTHHQLSPTANTANQNKRISSLLDVFKNHNCELFPREDVLKNLVTGQVYPDDVSHDILSAEKFGDELYDNVIRERLSEKAVWKFFLLSKRLSSEHSEVAIKRKS